MTRSHRCWFITNIWKSDHRLNMTDIKFTLSFLSAESLCWWQLFFSYFKTQKLWSEENLNTNGRGLFSDVGSAVFSVSHTSLTSKFQGQPLLSNSCWTASFCSRFMSLKAPHLCPNGLTRVSMHEYSQPDGIPSATDALRIHSCPISLFQTGVGQNIP